METKQCWLYDISRSRIALLRTSKLSLPGCCIFFVRWSATVTHRKWKVSVSVCATDCRTHHWWMPDLQTTTRSQWPHWTGWWNHFLADVPIACVALHEWMNEKVSMLVYRCIFYLHRSDTTKSESVVLAPPTLWARQPLLTDVKRVTNCTLPLI